MIQVRKSLNRGIQTGMGHRDHKERARGPVMCAVITVSDTRTPDTDESGRVAKGLLEGGGHQVVCYRIVKDEPAEIEAAVREAVGAGCQAVILNGGTGISRRDGTYEVISGLLEKTITGFGELFRFLSFQEIGSPAMLSRAIAGVFQGRLVAATPGSPEAVRLALERLLIPELAHLVWEISR